MHASATIRIIFSAPDDRIEAAADYLDKIQRGEYFFDDETGNLVLMIEEDLEISNKERVIAFVDRLYKRLRGGVDIHAIGMFNSISSSMHQMFECQYNKNYFRYRDAKWSSDYVLDEDLSYEEFEEENYTDMDEDEYDEYIHRAHKGIRNDDDDVYGEWDYID